MKGSPQSDNSPEQNFPQENSLQPEEDLSQKALDYGVQRYTGKDPVETARIRAMQANLLMQVQMKLTDAAALTSVLLFQLGQGSAWDWEEIEETFGREVRENLSATEQIARLELPDSPGIPEVQAFHESIFEISAHTKSLYGYLAGLLIKIRALKSEPNEQTQKWAYQVHLLFSPLFGQFGFPGLQAEFESHAFRLAYPQKYVALLRKFPTLLNPKGYLKRAEKTLQSSLTPTRLQVNLQGRQKSFFEIQQASQQQDGNQILPLYTLEFILPDRKNYEQADCWRIYSALTKLYPPSPRDFRDFLTVPDETTGLEGLFFYLLGPEGQWIEIEIQTERMYNKGKKAWQWEGTGEKKPEK